MSRWSQLVPLAVVAMALVLAGLGRAPAPATAVSGALGSTIGGTTPAGATGIRAVGVAGLSAGGTTAPSTSLPAQAAPAGPQGPVLGEPDVSGPATPLPTSSPVAVPPALAAAARSPVTVDGFGFAAAEQAPSTDALSAPTLQHAVDAQHSYALLAGADHYANARDLSTAIADATTLGNVLLDAGWLPDHVRVLADPDVATLRAGLDWLAANAGPDSTVVLSFSGHTRQRAGDPDGDGEAFDEGWWTADGGVLWDAELGQRLANVHAGRLWLTIQACEAGGYDDPGTLGPGRLVTWSSLEEEKSFEDPEAGFSTQGHRLFAEALRDGWGDADGDGTVSVQEAAGWSAPRVHVRTDRRQSPQVHDELGEPLVLTAR